MLRDVTAALRAGLHRWRFPFLAALGACAIAALLLSSCPFRVTPPAFYPLPADGLSFGDARADRYLAGGWWAAENGIRWTRGGGSLVRFALPAPERSAILELTLRPYLAPDKRTAQRLTLSLNDRPIGGLDVRDAALSTYRFVVPGDAIRRESTLRLETPDATRPRDVGDGSDERTLGVAVQSLRWRSAS
jgi:hypothetical protein